MLVLGFSGAAGAQGQMPDPSLINGKALPAGDLQTGTITVRVVRESIGNNVIGQQVRMILGGDSRTATTDEQGRAEFKGLPAGAEGHAEADVNGERLVSDPLVVPKSGGLRLILVAGLAQAAERRKREESEAAAAPPVRGAVVLGGNSRVVFEFPDDLLRVYYILEIVNNARARVDIGGPLIIDLPEEAAGAATLEGSSQSVTVNGTRMTVMGPFAAGVTPVQVGFQMPFSRAELVFAQKWPVPLEQVTVASQKVGAFAMSSAQFSTVGDVRAEDGQTYMLASGNALPAGGVLTIQLSNLPVHSSTPRNVALVLATVIGLVGIWLSLPARTRSTDARKRLLARRDALLADLAEIEKRTRTSGSESARDATRKQRIVAALEQIYGELDASPQGGGEGIAA
jgi:hypothetical protein